MNIHRLRDNIQDLEIAQKLITRVRGLERKLVGNEYSLASPSQTKTLEEAQKLINTVLADFYMFRGKHEGDEEE